jgi:hypothetical protein
MDYLVLNLYAILHTVTTPEQVKKKLVTRGLVNAKHKDTEINSFITSFTFVGPNFRIYFNTLMQ